MTASDQTLAPAPPTGARALVAAAARLADSTAFNVAILVVIALNAVVIGLETYDGVAREHGDLLHALNGAFLAIFVAELAIRIVAHGGHPLRFFRSGWNVFDFLVVAAAIAPGISGNTALLRLARLARVLRVIRLLPDLRILTVAVARSLPGVASLALLTVVLLYVYGIVGWMLFGDADPRFGTIGEAMLTLFVLLSLENLPDYVEAGRAISEWTVVYYVSFVIVAALLVLNFLVGVVISSMEEAHAMEDEREREARRAAAAASPGTEDDREVAVEDRLLALRAALEELEAELRPARRRS